MTNEMWETEEDGKVEGGHVSVSHLRVWRKVENVEGELRLKQKWRDSEFEYDVLWNPIQ